MKAVPTRKLLLPFCAVVSCVFLGCWIPAKIWQSGNPKNLPDWPQHPAEDSDHHVLTFKVGDRFELVRPMFLEKNSRSKPPYYLAHIKGGVAEHIDVLPAGTVIRIVALKDGTVSGSGVKEYCVIEGMEKYGWIFVAGEPSLHSKNGMTFYEFDRDWLRKL